MSDLRITRIGPDQAGTLLAVVRAAFGARPAVDPPPDALTETEESLAALLAPFGGLLATVDGEPVGGLVLDPVGVSVYLRRFGVLPSAQGHGVATALVEAAEEAAEGYVDLRVLAREELPRTVRFWEHKGFARIGRTPPLIALSRPLRPPRLTRTVHTPEELQDLGRRLGPLLRAGDLLILTGDLGAGKTTFTQGLGEGLGVRGPITSPTFVIARIHPSLRGGPDLVHVDAYRLGSIEELEDLDLDTDFDEVVTVVEWGSGIAEVLGESRLEVRIGREEGRPGELEHGESRQVELFPVGPRWRGASWQDLH